VEVDWQQVAHAALYVLVAGLAWSFGARRPSHRLVCFMFLMLASTNLGRMVLARVLDPAPLPYDKALLLAYYADHALGIVTHVGFLAVCARHFAKVPLRWGVVASAATVIVFIVYKETTGASLVPFHQGMAITCTAIGWVLVTRAVLAPRDRFVAPDAAHAVLMLLLAADLVKLIHDYTDSYPSRWEHIRYLDLIVCGIIAVGYAVALVRVGVRRWRISQS